MADEVVIVNPNRDKATTKTTKTVVALLLVVSTVLMAIVAFGGWNKLSGQQIPLIAYMLVYLLLAVQVTRWSRGALPVAAALAIILAIFAAVAGQGWFARANPGFARAHTILGGVGLDANLLGLVTYVIVPVQLLLLVFTLQGFVQEWQVELEIPADQAGNYGRAAAPRPA